MSQSTSEREYTERLLRLESAWWRRWLDVQAPYRWHLRRLRPGFVLDVGCGLGRHLVHLAGHGVGIDHNLHSVSVARERGLEAFLPDEFEKSRYNTPNTFDSILLSHVAEHMHLDEVVRLLRRYLHLLKPGGKIILITPQECGYRSDPTHAQFMGFEQLHEIGFNLDLRSVRSYSFPFPRFMGRFFRHNEFVVVCERK